MAQSYEPWNAPGATTMCRVDRARLYGGTMPPAFPSRGRLKLNSLASRLHRWKIFGTKKPFRMEMMLRRNYLDINFQVFINELWRFLMDSGWIKPGSGLVLAGTLVRNCGLSRFGHAQILKHLDSLIQFLVLLMSTCPKIGEACSVIHPGRGAILGD